MTSLAFYQIDAFTSRLFHGNPAGVVPLTAPLDDATLQAIAAEVNLAETAFLSPRGDAHRIRWFTPVREVGLCGHATLAAAFVVLEHLDPGAETVSFESRSGPLTVARDGERLCLDFPASPLERVAEPPGALLEGLATLPVEVWIDDAVSNYLAVYDAEDAVRELSPDLGVLEELDPYGVAVTAPGGEADCVSRYFAPSYGIPEDPVTGSAHCAIVPYWARRLGRPRIHAVQASSRGGELWCEDRGGRVSLSGHAVPFLEGRINVPQG